MYEIFFQPIKLFLQINDTIQKALGRLKIYNMRDLIFYKPTSYNIIKINPDFNSIQDGDFILAEVTLDDVLRPSSRTSPLKIQVSSNTGSIILIFFNKIPPFIFSRLCVGQKYKISGKVQVFNHLLQITHPEFIFKKDLIQAILPIYPLTYGLVNKQLYGYILEAINVLENALNVRKSITSNSDKAIEENKYIRELLNEIKTLHFIGMQPNRYNIEKTLNLNMIQLSTKELFANQISLARIKTQEHKKYGRVFMPQNDLQQSILSKLGFELTQGQKEAIDEIEQDQSSNLQMMRLLQGDVGCGKTLVALITILNVVKANVQAAFMVPTDLLTVQHHQFFCQALENTGIKVEMLTGKTSAKEKKYIRETLIQGKIDILIGTHALFQEGVEFKDLGYIIIDEQHKFGVGQRLELIKKASHPDILVMTATPIPRSLTLTMFGDMNVSKIKNKPGNRLPIITSVIPSSKKLEVVASLNKKLSANEKIYWVCPLIDQSDKTLENTISNDNEFEIFADINSRFIELNQLYMGRVAMIHGKMKNIDKDQVMQEFKEGKFHILVATTVIEVGIDVAESTLIIIENAEKFGLAQLHQLRGRVGRGNKQSYCLLMYNEKRMSKIARERLKILRESNDGFYIAEQDLLLRGGGEILGTKQSGEPVFFFADLNRDLNLLLHINNTIKSVQFNEFTEFLINLFARNKTELVQSG